MSEVSVTHGAIGIIHSEHLVPAETPIQPNYAKGCTGRVEALPALEQGLQDLDGFSHIDLVYHMHKAGPAELVVRPFLDDAQRGVFATCAPCRPNAIGLSIAELSRRDGNALYVDGLDGLDGMPVLDIKPHAARFDRMGETRNGWQDSVDEPAAERRGRREYRTGACAS